MKRLLTMLLAVVMVFSLAACGGEKANPKANFDIDFEIGDTGGLEVPFGNGETIEILCSDEVGDSTTYIFEKLSQVVGLNVVPMLVPSSTMTQKLNVLLAGGDLPDITSAGSLIQTNEYGTQGAFVAVNDYLDEMPNFNRCFGKDSPDNWVFKSLAAENKKLYVFPTYYTNRVVNHGMLYRKDIFDKHGIKMWNSPETFYQALKKLKEIYPDSYPLTSKTGAKLIQNYAVAWGGIRSYGMYYNEDEKLWKYSDTDPKTKEILDYFKKLYDEKLLDPEFLTNTQPAWTQRMTTGSSFVTYDWIGRLDMFQEQSTIPGYDLRYGNPVGPKQTLVTLDQVSLSGNCVTNNKVSDLSIKVMDFLYSDAGAEMMTLGIKGETYDIDANGEIVYLDEELSKKAKIDIMDLRSKYCMWMSGAYKRVDPRSCYFDFTEREQEAQDWVEKCGGLEPADPVVTLVGDISTRASDINNRLTKKFEEVMFKYIVGTETGDAAWEKWLKEAKKLGEDEICKIYNDRHKELGL